eukprot:12934264-Prorocentrum_lima.AAC.1
MMFAWAMQRNDGEAVYETVKERNQYRGRKNPTTTMVMMLMLVMMTITLIMQAEKRSTMAIMTLTTP